MTDGKKGTETKKFPDMGQVATLALFTILLLCVGLVVSLVWFLSLGRYLSALLSLLAALALAGAAGRFLLLVTTQKRQ